MLDLKAADLDGRRFIFVFTERFLRGSSENLNTVETRLWGKNKIFLCRQIKTPCVPPLALCFRRVFAHSDIGNSHTHTLKLIIVL